MVTLVSLIVSLLWALCFPVWRISLNNIYISLAYYYQNLHVSAVYGEILGKCLFFGPLHLFFFSCFQLLCSLHCSSLLEHMVPGLKQVCPVCNDSSSGFQVSLCRSPDQSLGLANKVLVIHCLQELLMVSIDSVSFGIAQMAKTTWLSCSCITIQISPCIFWEFWPFSIGKVRWDWLHWSFTSRFFCAPPLFSRIAQTHGLQLQAPPMLSSSVDFLIR